METKTEVLTMEQAIEKGYAHFVENEGEHIVELYSVTPDDREYYKEKQCYIVDMNAPKHYSISSDTIKDLIVDYVGRQEEMADEDGKLCDIADEHDYSELADALNKKFETIKYYEPSDIEVTF